MILHRLVQTTRLPNFEMWVTGRDCVCSWTHCFSAVTCDLHPTKPFLNLPYVQWYDGRDGPWEAADDRIRDEVSFGRSLGWNKRASIAVFRGALNPLSTIRDLPGDRFEIHINPKTYKHFGRGKLLAIRQKNPGYLNVSVLPPGIEPNWTNYHYRTWILRLDREGLEMDDPPSLSMRDQAKNFKYGVYAEGSCGWADRLKWMLALGIVPLFQV